MAYTAYSGEFVPFRSVEPARQKSRPGVWRRIFDRIFASRMKHSDREVARYLARTGGRITDDIERRMTEHLLRGDWRFHD